MVSMYATRAEEDVEWLSDVRYKVLPDNVFHPFSRVTHIRLADTVVTSDTRSTSIAPQVNQAREVALCQRAHRVGFMQASFEQ